MVRRQRLNALEAHNAQLERELRQARAATAGVTLPTFCRDFEAVFAHPTVVPRPSAAPPTDPREAEDRYYPARVVKWTRFGAEVQHAFRQLSARIQAAHGGNAAVLPPAFAYEQLGGQFVRSCKVRKQSGHHALQRLGRGGAGQPDICLH
jgi:hypothetical protein